MRITLKEQYDNKGSFNDVCNYVSMVLPYLRLSCTPRSSCCHTSISKLSSRHSWEGTAEPEPGTAQLCTETSPAHVWPLLRKQKGPNLASWADADLCYFASVANTNKCIKYQLLQLTQEPKKVFSKYAVCSTIIFNGFLLQGIYQRAKCPPWW